MQPQVHLALGEAVVDGVVVPSPVCVAVSSFVDVVDGTSSGVVDAASMHTLSHI